MGKLKLLMICVLTALSSAGARSQDSYQLSSHLLDISLGKPASGVVVHLFRYNETSHEWDYVYQTRSDDNGRIEDLLPSGNDNRATYKLRFDTSEYFTAHGENSLYPFIEVVFVITDRSSYHIPVLISANGYSTYRGN
ncbi:MAG: hydroxyisourate hydrolase [Alistipes sp.]|nr:hydroxyisourate hydrolase [Alistipes sp.]